MKESNQNIDAPQKFAVAGIFELPFGRGRKYAQNANGVVNGIIGGWQMNWDVIYQSGWVVDYPNAPQVQPGSAKLSEGRRSRSGSTPHYGSTLPLDAPSAYRI